MVSICLHPSVLMSKVSSWGIHILCNLSQEYISFPLRHIFFRNGNLTSRSSFMMRGLWFVSVLDGVFTCPKLFYLPLFYQGTYTPHLMFRPFTPTLIEEQFTEKDILFVDKVMSLKGIYCIVIVIDDKLRCFHYITSDNKIKMTIRSI